MTTGLEWGAGVQPRSLPALNGFAAGAWELLLQAVAALVPIGLTSATSAIVLLDDN